MRNTASTTHAMPSDQAAVGAESNEGGVHLNVCGEVKPDDDNIDCSICLQPKQYLGRLVRLQCRHTYCASCLVHYVTRKLDVTSWHHANPDAMIRATNWLRQCTCPLCMDHISPNELRNTIGTSSSLEPWRKLAYCEALLLGERGLLMTNCPERLTSVAEAAEPSLAALRGQARADKAFRAYARGHHLKRCPRCSVIIQKNGGCNNMICSSCELSFRWNEAPFVCMCRGYHYSIRFPFVHSCSHVPIARMPARDRLCFQAQRAAVVCPAIAVTAGVLAPWFIGAILPSKAARTIKRAWKSYQQRKQRERWRADQSAELDRMIACRRTQAHEWIMNWCCNCGAIRSP